MTIKFIDTQGNPPRKLADVEIHFTHAADPLAGLKLVGFALWQRTHKDRPPIVTFPSRQYSVNGERRSFALLRPVSDPAEAERLRAFILAAWEARQVAREKGLSEDEANAAITDPRDDVRDDGQPRTAG